MFFCDLELCVLVYMGEAYFIMVLIWIKDKQKSITFKFSL